MPSIGDYKWANSSKKGVSAVKDWWDDMTTKIKDGVVSGIKAANDFGAKVKETAAASTPRGREKAYQKSIYETNVADTNEQYDRINGVLAGERSTAEQNADITYRRLAKYLPMQARAQGLGGTYAETAAGLKAYNTYMNAMNDTAATHATAVADNEARRAATLKDYKRIYDENVADIDEKWDDREYEEQQRAEEQKRQDEKEAEAKKTATWTENYNYALKALELSDGVTEAAVLGSILDDYEMSPEQESLIRSYAAALAKDNAEAASAEAVTDLEELMELGATADEIDAAIEAAGLGDKLSPSELVTLEKYKADNPNIGGATYTGLSAFTKGNNFEIDVGNNSYEVQLGARDKSEGVVNAAQSVGDKKLFSYGGEIYIALETHDGSKWAYRVEPRFLQQNKSDNDYNKLKAKYAN